MSSSVLSRRTILAGSTAGAALAAIGDAPAFAATLTVGDILARMKTHVGGPWRDGGVDRIIAGSADLPVRGVATVMMATFDSLKSSLRQGCNFVITHEPTYWSHPDTLTDLQQDPLYLTKLDYIKKNGMATFHFHDHWHALRPVDGINYGTAQTMGWIKYMHSDNQRLYTLPPTTLLALAKEFQKKLGDRTMRVVGDPRLPVSIVYESWGNCSEFPGVNFLDSEADVLVIGEAQDWDLICYAQDLVAAGKKKGFILLGHVLSEQQGMKYAADWLKTFVTEVPVKYVPIIEPYWNLQKPVMEINTRL